MIKTIMMIITKMSYVVILISLLIPVLIIMTNDSYRTNNDITLYKNSNINDD